VNNLKWIAFSIVMLGTIIALIFGQRTAIRKRRLRFQGRSDMNEEEFFSAYYKEAGIVKETVFEVLRQVADATEIPATRIRPSDRFDRELAPVKGWEFGDGIVEISWFVKREMKKAGVHKPAQLQTVDDLIRYVARLETQKG